METLRRRDHYLEQDGVRDTETRADAVTQEQSNLQKLSDGVKEERNNCSWPIGGLFSILFLIRLFNAFTIHTFFQPDEFYQALEPAHRFVFGYGYVSWEWTEGLRSSLHPLVYAFGYKLVSIWTPEYKYTSMAPKVTGALIAAIGEVHLYVFVKRYTNTVYLAKMTVILSVLNVFNWHVITRSFANSFEMTLTTIALAYWPWRSKDYKRLPLSCGVAFVSCIIRPTNAIIWIVLGVYYISILSPSDMIKVLGMLLCEFGVVMGVSIGADRLFYGFYTIPLWNFVQFNVVKNLSIFYGTSPWHFHIFQSVPIMLMTYLPMFTYSVYAHKLYNTILGIVLIVTIGAFSMIQHKEFRFLYPLMPILLLFTAYSSSKMQKQNHKNFKFFAAIIISINIFLGVFFTRINERGEIDVIEYLRTSGTDFGLLVPCHSTPWQSHLHNQQFDSSWFITCEPPLHLFDYKQIDAYRDESDRMFDDPSAFVSQNFPPILSSTSLFKYTWPSQLVIYDNFEEMKQILGDTGYRECHRFFNSVFHWDPRRSGDIIVYCRNDL